MDTLLVAPSTGLEVEVLAKAKRRRFTLEYKRRIVRAADRCRKPGEIGALLRREGLYSSHLSAWRAARELGGQGARKRGPEAKLADPSAKRIVQLEQENRRLRQRAERAEALVEVQKKLSELLGIAPQPNDE